MPNPNANGNNGTSNNSGNSFKVTTVLANIGVIDSPEEETTSRKEGIDNSISGAAKEISYTDTKVIGNGSFGVVFQAKLVETGEPVAIKKVLQDKRFKNRELQIMKELNHCNIVKLKYYFYCTGEKKDDIFLNLVLEYVPETVYRIARHYTKSKLALPMIYVKLYLYQLFRALAYIHFKGICHRDIKPQNLLLDPETSVLKLCDFGSAKQLVKGEPNVSYICSRYYRAPELIFGATDYSWNIDIWSAGCVLAELMLGRPLFPGESGVDQLVEIIKILGTPSREQIRQMNPNYVEFKFPHIKPHPWNKVFKNRIPPEAIDLISKLLEYIPSQRLSPLQACAHPFFDELRNLNTTLPDGGPLPPLFTFTPLELNICPPLNAILIPPQYETNFPPPPTSHNSSSHPTASSNPKIAHNNSNVPPAAASNAGIGGGINDKNSPVGGKKLDLIFGASKQQQQQPTQHNNHHSSFTTGNNNNNNHLHLSASSNNSKNDNNNRRSDTGTPSKLLGNCSISAVIGAESQEVFPDNALPDVPINSLISANVVPPSSAATEDIVN